VATSLGSCCLIGRTGGVGEGKAASLVIIHLIATLSAMHKDRCQPPDIQYNVFVLGSTTNTSMHTRRQTPVNKGCRFMLKKIDSRPATNNCITLSAPSCVWNPCHREHMQLW
jgi:hypothetical protein